MIYPLNYIELPIMKKKIKIRSMNCAEERILLYAKESKNLDDIILAINQVVENCLVDKSILQSISLVDLLSIYLKIRAVSAANIIQVSYEDNEDKKTYEFEVDLDQISVINKNTSNIIKFDDITIKLKYSQDLTNIPSFIESINGISNFNNNDLITFIESLPIDIINDITNYINNQPYLYYKIEYKNKLNHNRKIEFKSIEDFFYLSLTRKKLTDYYFMMIEMKNRNWSFRDIETMMPFERDLYLDLSQKKQDSGIPAGYHPV